MSSEIKAACDVVVVGSCNQDLVAYAPKLPRLGETVHGSSFTMDFGGKGANQAVMCAKMGARVEMVGKLGSDIFGDNYLANLVNCGIGTSQVLRTSEASTGVALINVATGGAEASKNFITIVSGANGLLSPADVASAGPTVAGARVLVCQLEIKMETTLAALRAARAAGVTTVFNPAPAPASLPDDLLPLCDIVCPNETELEALLPGAIDVDDLESVCAGALALLEKGPMHVIVTLGARGALWATRDAAAAAAATNTAATAADAAPPPWGPPPVVQKAGAVHFPAAEVHAVDTVGAGDAFLGAVAAYLAREVPLGRAIPMACGVAGMSTTKAGAQRSYPSRSELPKALRLG